MTTATITGLDLALNDTGCATAEGVKTISAPKGMAGMERLHWLRTNIIEQCAFGPQSLVVMEDLAFSRNKAGAKENAGLAYLIRYELWTHSVPFLLVAPNTLKKFVTGKGNAEKSLMLLEVFKRFGVSAANDNEADAVGLYYIGLAYAGQWEPTTDAQREVLATLRGEKPKKAKKKRAAVGAGRDEE